jgi:competence protein ComEC
MAVWPRQTTGFSGAIAALRGAFDRIETWLDAERDQLPLWLPVAFGAGIGGWFALSGPAGWGALILAGAAVAALGVALGAGRRLGQSLIWAGLALALGCALVWGRALIVAAPVLDRPAITRFAADIESVAQLTPRQAVRLVLRPVDRPDLPPRLRLTARQQAAPADLMPGDRIRLTARLAPPMPPAMPGAHDPARAAWFAGIGATGRALGAVDRLTRAPPDRASGLRVRLGGHVAGALPARAAGIAVALATGDQGRVGAEDQEALRRAGLAHLLSVSGLHVTALVGAVMFVVLRVLALSPGLALRWSLPLVAAAAGAAAGAGYTWLTGAEVPTVRALVAALLVLAGLALGREALTLRLVAAGALVVLALWPEALIGASFQFSFAAVTAIVALHDHPAARRLFARRDEGVIAAMLRALVAILASGLAVEIVLAPIALYHFHQQGVYGALANLVAIPLTTFIIMPAEALALALDTAGLGAPLWWITGRAIDLLLALAHLTAAAPGAVFRLPLMPGGAALTMLAGGLWLLLWARRHRWLGLAAMLGGALWAVVTPPPDLIVTGDGRHVAVRDPAGDYAGIRAGHGGFVDLMLADAVARDEPLASLALSPDARCSPDACLVTITRNGRTWRLLATRTDLMMPFQPLIAACAAADIVVSDRRLPAACRPRWIKLDQPALVRSGGVAIRLRHAPWLEPAIRSGDRHPWRVARLSPRGWASAP